MIIDMYLRKNITPDGILTLTLDQIVGDTNINYLIYIGYKVFLNRYKYLLNPSF